MNLTDFDGQLNHLKEIVGKAETGNCKWRDVWDEIKRIAYSFKKFSNVSDVDKNNIWSRFNVIICHVIDINLRQNEINYQNESRSLKLKNKVINYVKNIRKIGEFENVIAGAVSIVARTFAENRSFQVSKRDLYDIGHKLTACSRILKEAQDFFFDHQHQMLKCDQEVASDALYGVQDDLAYACNVYEDSKIELSEAYKDSFCEQVDNKIQKLELRLKKLYSSLTHRQDYISHLENKSNSALDDDIKDSIDNWISEEEEHVYEIQESIKMVEEFLERERAKLKKLGR